MALLVAVSAHKYQKKKNDSPKKTGKKGEAVDEIRLEKRKEEAKEGK